METSNQNQPQIQQTFVIVGKQKSVGVAFLLAFFFGPLGLLYASVFGGVVMFLAAIIIGFITLGLGLVFVWIGCIIWAVVAAGNANKKMATGAGLNINTNFSGQQPQQPTQPIQQTQPKTEQQTVIKTNEPSPINESPNQVSAELKKVFRATNLKTSPAQPSFDLAQWFDKNKKSVFVGAGFVIGILILIVAVKYVLSLDFGKSTPSKTEALTIIPTQPKNQKNVSSKDETANINNTINEKSSSNKSVTDLGNGISKFKGAWFEIKYPSSFIIRPSLKSTTSDGYSSAFFMSPDKDEEFYIFSPQWKGNATDVDLNPNTERVVSDITQYHKNQIIRYFTYETKDKSYTRSYQETTESAGAVKWVIGLKYKNQSSYTKYKKQYLAFKSSLAQFAD